MSIYPSLQKNDAPARAGGYIRRVAVNLISLQERSHAEY